MTGAHPGWWVAFGVLRAGATASHRGLAVGQHASAARSQENMRFRYRPLLWWGLASVFGSIVFGSTSAVASPKPVASLAPIISDLSAADSELALRAVAQLAATRLPGAHDALLDALALGLRPEVAAVALNTIAARPSRSSLDVVLAYARNRSPTARSRAVAALGPFARLQPSDARVVPALLTALGDDNAEVRAEAGHALAENREPRAVPLLLALLREGDASAAEPLAALANADLAVKVAELSGQVSDAVLVRCLGAMLRRADLGPESLYVALVRAVGALPGDSALAALIDFVAAQNGAERPSRREARALIEARRQTP